MKITLILAGAIALVLISMERPASGSPPSSPPKAIASLMSDSLNDKEGLVRQKRQDECHYYNRCTIALDYLQQIERHCARQLLSLDCHVASTGPCPE